MDRILVVDDSSTMRRIVANCLKEAGYGEYEVIEAADGKEALDQLAKEPRPVLVLLDWNMPNMNGLATLKAIRADEANKGIPVIMVTTEAERTQVLTAIKAGATNYVIKPFQPQTLKEKVDAAFGAK